MKVTITVTANELEALQKFAAFKKMPNPCETECSPRDRAACCGCPKGKDYEIKAKAFQSRYAQYRDIFNSDFGQRYVELFNGVFAARERATVAENEAMIAAKEFDKFMEDVVIEAPVEHTSHTTKSIKKPRTSLAEDALKTVDSVMMGVDYKEEENNGNLETGEI